MRTHRRTGLDRYTAERLLSAAASAPDGRDPLARVLAAAAAPPHRGEFTGERAASAAFRAAFAASIGQPHHRSTVERMLLKLLTLKAAIGAALLAAATAGGLALAGSTGLLPDSLGGQSTAGGSANGGRPTVSAWRTASPSADPPTTAAAPSGATAQSPSPSLVGLCQAYTAAAIENAGTALDNPAFAVLIDAAGGPSKVADYCQALLATAAASTPPATGDQPGRPSDRPPNPTGKPTDLPGGPPATEPTDLPGGPPTTKPTGRRE